MRLKELREAKKITQAKLAEQIKMPLITYTKYENQIREPKIETLIKLANFYNVSLDYLVGREFNNEVGYLNENEKTMLAMFRQLNKDNQTRVIGEVAGILIAQM